jgi:tetratricopeptide (TPR) repeat protein/predicted Ser/Thr protein kinase
MSDRTPLKLLADSIRREQRAAWHQGVRRRIEDYLVKNPELDSDPELVLDLIYAEFCLRKELEDSVDSDEYLRRFPQFGTQLRRQFEVDAALEPASTVELQRDRETPSPSGRPFVLSSARIGDYMLLNELGRGGMGVVYRALQQSANREVALKIIRSDRLGDANADNAIVTRFITEAQAAARLIHDHVVPVYDVGQAGGVHYYSMRYVGGRSLAAILHEGPLECARAAAYIEGVARAAHHAHDQGILHRDLKPQNVLVESESDRALVTDFGLAKIVGETTAITQSGQIFGSPSYMAPEQTLDASNVSNAADIYGIGATLYHAIVGRPPFQAATIAETLRQVQETIPVRPRHLNPGIDKDLETICLKCLEKNPLERYPTAEHLADDLRRYRQHQPIHARRIGWPGRCQRWCRRRPLVAGMSAVIAALVIAGSIGVLWQWRRAEVHRRIAQENFAFSRLAVNDLFVEVSQNDMLNEPGMQPLRAKLLKRALQYFLTFVERHSDDASSQRDLAEALLNIGSISEEIDTAEKALEFYRRAQNALTALATGQHPDEHVAALSSKSRQGLARVHTRLGNTVQARQEYEAALKELEHWSAARPDAWPLLLDQAKIHFELVKLFQSTSQRELSRKHALRARALLKTLPLDEEAAWAAGLDLAGSLAAWFGNYDEAIQARSALLRSHPESIRQRFELAELYFRQGESQRQKSAKLAISSYEESLKHIEPLFQANRDVKPYQRLLAEVYDKLAFTLASNGQTDRAFDLYEKARSAYEELISFDPADVSNRNFLATIYNGLALVARDRHQIPAAMAWFHKALEIQDRLVTEFPDLSQVRRDRSGTHHNIGRTYERNRQFKEAAQSYRQAIELLNGWELRDVHDAAVQSNSWASLIDVLHRLGEADQVLEALSDSEKLCRHWLAANPESQSFRLALAKGLCVRVQVYAQSKKYASAIQAAADADSILRSLQDVHLQSNDDLLNISIALHNNLAVSHQRLGQAEQAAQYYAQVIQASDQLESASGMSDQSVLLNALVSYGSLRLSAGDHEAAIGAFDRAVGLSSDLRIQLVRADALNRSGRYQAAVEAASKLASADDPRIVFAASAVFSRAAEAAARDASLPEAERMQNRSRFMQQGLESLETAKQKGFFDDAANRELLTTHPELNELRHHESFDDFLKALPQVSQ